MAEKKVVLVVVEGPTDQAAFGTIFEEYFHDSQVQFHVVLGDITTQDYITPDEIIKKINEILVMLKNQYGYSYEQKDPDEIDSTDYLKIIHITDTDGVFIPENLVQENNSLPDKKILYFIDHMESYSKQKTINRNKRKAEILIKLSKQNRIHGIPYKIYYNSCNLEHILYGILSDLSGEEKMDLADAFADRYEGDPDKFIQFISDESFAVTGTYQQTWRYIYKTNTTNSLNRHTNMHLIFQQPLSIQSK